MDTIYLRCDMSLRDTNKGGIMKRVNVIEKFNTSWGLTFVVENIILKVGDVFSDQYNVIYVVEKIIMPTRPVDNERYTIVVKKHTGI